MIYGIGTDIVDVKRIDEVISRQGERFIERVLSPAECAEAAQVKSQTLDGARSFTRFVAKRWAAKEAFAKAFGLGIGEVVSFQDITISHDEHGKPLLLLSESLQAAMTAAGAGQSHLTISDEAEYAVAFVVIERR
jgi:holo-[acyl-carrier protein] synthase